MQHDGIFKTGLWMWNRTKEKNDRCRISGDGGYLTTERSGHVMHSCVKCCPPEVIYPRYRKWCYRKCTGRLFLGTALGLVWMVAIVSQVNRPSPYSPELNRLALINPDWSGLGDLREGRVSVLSNVRHGTFASNISGIIIKEQPRAKQTRTAQPPDRDHTRPDSHISLKPPESSRNLTFARPKLYFPSLLPLSPSLPSADLKSLLLYGGLGALQSGPSLFKEHKCSETRCTLSGNASLLQTDEGRTLDVVIFHNLIPKNKEELPPKYGEQVWVLFLLESPLHSPDFGALDSKINWTFTYRRDSTVITPYGHFVLNSPQHNEDMVTGSDQRNFAAGKSRLVAWFVSNCGSRNGRLAYARDLQRHLTVDVYGVCGSMFCDQRRGEECLRLLQTTYKFYLSFENSNCRDYITEKFWKVFNHDVVPVVMGASKADYEAVAPPGSFIHVEDFPSPAKLAEYLVHLDGDDAAYNRYFRWRKLGHFRQESMWCKLCDKLHNPGALRNPSWYEDVEAWWRPLGVCSKPDFADFQLGIDFVAQHQNVP